MTKYSIFLIAAMLATTGCGPKNESSSSVDSATSILMADTLAAAAEPMEVANNIVQYEGATDDEVKKSLETFLPFKSVAKLAYLFVHTKDSVESERGTQDLTNPEDKLFLDPFEENAYQAILDYKKLMESGTPPDGSCPRLIDLTRIPKASDSSSHYLPKISSAGALSHGNFFFLGGAPFISRIEEEENTRFSDPEGKFEKRFAAYITENTRYLFNSIYHAKPGRVNIEYGPPLDSYDYGPQDVRGIGSLLHKFAERIPVQFITEAGLVPGHLIAVRLKLADESLGCVSDLPNITLACEKDINEKDILGIYIPYGSSSISTATINRPFTNTWTTDVNNDGVPDLACVTGTFQGIISDAMTECLWFVNVNGTWKVLDWGDELDCT